MNAPQDLLDMLTYKRPHLSSSEDDFICRFILPYVDEIDDVGNLYVTVGNPSPKVLFSCHTDSVHRIAGSQKIEVTQDGWILKPTHSQDCLGADCAAGVWLMIEMIKANVPGLYIFHRGEECGGIGSSHIARHEAHVLTGIEAAIAFDRYGYKSIITHQFGERCCSDTFAESLIQVLGNGEWWEKDDGGSFTDTANYTDLIPECTNISVGYFDQHTAREAQNYEFILILRELLIRADWSKLVIARDPNDRTDDYTYWFRKKYKKYMDHDLANDPYQYTAANAELDDLIEFCTKHPEVAARTLLDTGFRADDLYQDLHTYAA